MVHGQLALPHCLLWYCPLYTPSSRSEGLKHTQTYIVCHIPRKNKVSVEGTASGELYLKFVALETSQVETSQFNELRPLKTCNIAIERAAIAKHALNIRRIGNVPG